jgi:hypothetical protein
MQYTAFLATRPYDLQYLVHENNTLSVDCVTHAKHGTTVGNVKAVFYKSTNSNLKVSMSGLSLSEILKSG